MNNKKRTFIIRTIVFACILALFVELATYVFMAKESFYKNEEFFSEKQEFDVCFFGSSHSENFFDPMALWRDYGITSYNFGNPKEPIPVTYWVIENVINKNKPKIVVLDIHCFNNTNDLDDFSEYIHYGLDSFPLTGKKISAINDLCKTFSEELEMIFPIAKYHARWKDLGKDHSQDIDYFIKGTLSYGHTYTMRVEKFEDNILTDDIAEVSNDSKDLYYLNRLIDLCNRNDIELVFVSTPFSMGQVHQKNINYMDKFCKEKNIPFVNYNRMDSIINMHTDLYNVEHVNQSGLLKVTDYIGSYLKKNYDLIDHREDEKYISWDKYYNDFYLNLKYESLWAVDSINSALMLLHDRDYNSAVLVDDFRLSENEDIKELISNVDPKCDLCILSDDEDSINVKHTDEIKGFLEKYDMLDVVSVAHPELSDVAAVIVSMDKKSQVNLVKLYINNGSEVVCENVFSSIAPKYIFKE